MKNRFVLLSTLSVVLTATMLFCFNIFASSNQLSKFFSYKSEIVGANFSLVFPDETESIELLEEVEVPLGSLELPSETPEAIEDVVKETEEAVSDDLSVVEEPFIETPVDEEAYAETPVDEEAYAETPADEEAYAETPADEEAYAEASVDNETYTEPIVLQNEESSSSKEPSSLGMQESHVTSVNDSSNED